MPRLCCLLLAGCPAVDPIPSPPTTSPDPAWVVDAAVALAEPAAPLSRWLTVTTDRATTLDVSWVDPRCGPTAIHWPRADEHEVILAGFHPDTTVDLVVEVTDDDGTTLAVDGLVVATPPLPDHFAIRDRLSADEARIQPGLNVVPTRPISGSIHDAHDYIVALDAAAHVVWYYTSDRFVYDARLQDSGRLLLAEIGSVVEVDLAGRRLAAWQPEGWPVAIDDHAIDVVGLTHEIHHEVFPMADGGLLTLTFEPRLVPGFPTNYATPQPTIDTEIADDHVVILDRDGTLRQRWSTADLLDPQRIGYDSLRSRSSDVIPAPRDWGHANAVIAAEDGDIVVSLRHQDAVVRFDPTTGALRWILANHDNWPPELAPFLLEPIGPLTWPYHQHAPDLGPDGQILMFDNGNDRASPYTDQIPIPDRDNASRAVAYRIDDVAMTITQTFESVANPNSGPIYASQIGDADWLDNGNVLITYGHATHYDGRPTLDLGLSQHTVRIVEVTPEGDTVWDLELYSDPADDPLGWTANRTQRVPSLYPHTWRSR